jgi:tetratricopeptide (TPR) repeat protein
MNCFVGRTKEKNSLYHSYDAAKEGRGKLILIAGEAGVGKTSLVEETLAHSSLRVFTARCSDERTPPYGPIITILRNCIRESDGSKIDCGHLTKYLPYILPELGKPPSEVDAETLKESIIAALFSIAAKEATAFFIDDINWADNATVDLLTLLSDNLSSKKLVVICTYRSDELTREHRIKKFRNDLRRRRKLVELLIEPLSYESTQILVSKLIDGKPAKDLIEKVFSITLGFPLFIEELIESFKRDHLLTEKEGMTSIRSDVEFSIPETLKDTVMHRLEGLSDDAKSKLEICAAAGVEFSPDLIMKISGNEKGFDELFIKNILKEVNPDTVIFRHSLIRDAVNSQIIWSRRRSLHKKIAEQLSSVNAHPDKIAEHWLSANEVEKAREEFIKSSEESCRIYAYSDAAKSLNKALELWTEESDSKDKIDTLFRYAKCSQMSGNLSEALKAVKEIIENNSTEIKDTKIAEAHRISGAIYSIQGLGELAAASRLKAADLFYNSGMIAESASELLITAGRYTALLRLELAFKYAVKSFQQAKEAGLTDIETQAQALSGNILAMQGKFEAGRNVVREALSTAIKNNLADAASIIYRRLASTLEYASDYHSAKDAYFNAYNYCMTEGKEISAQICLGCMSNTLFLTGEWKKSLEICDEVINNKNSPEGSLLIGFIIKGFIFALRGEIKKALGNLDRALELSRKLNIVVVELGSLWGMAVVSEINSDIKRSLDYYKSILQLWEETQDRHDSIIMLIWAVNFFSQNSLKQELTQCTEALSTISAATGNSEALTGSYFRACRKCID